MRASLPPGPSIHPLIQGVGLWSRPLAYLERLRARYGKRFTIQFPFTVPFVMITEPDQVREIYTAPADVLHPGEGARVLEPIVGLKSVILLDEGAHLEQRKLLLPTFHGERMDALTDLVTEVTEREVASWAEEPEVALHPRLQALTLEIILRAIFGLEEGDALTALRTRLARLLSYGDNPLTLVPDPSPRQLEILDRFGPIKGFLTTRKEVDQLVFEQIDRRRREGGGGADILSTLLEARHEDGSEMSAQELRDELMTLLVAGHETTASSLAWTFARLAREPTVLARLTDEAGAGEDDAYLTATIQEVLRRRPVLPNTAPRMVKQPIEVGGWLYPAGVCLVANAYLLHHDADIYPDPYEFRPERFLERPPGTYTWIPFGGGRRRCLGASFALLEMKIVIASVIKTYGLQPAGRVVEMPRRRNITVRPEAGAAVRLERRAALPVAA
ncbi:MAG: cytochrome P450 [Thermoleophilaceae bacterium]|nr:cytochrome P450 [Thermoleophilaceae bacterium]